MADGWDLELRIVWPESTSSSDLALATDLQKSRVNLLRPRLAPNRLDKNIGLSPKYPRPPEFCRQISAVLLRGGIGFGLLALLLFFHGFAVGSVAVKPTLSQV